MIYRTEHAAVWQQACVTGMYPPDGNFDGEGFIHCSALEQIESAADRFHHGEHDLVLLCISQQLLHCEVHWEIADDGLYYPHVYGVLTPDAVVAVLPFPCGSDGTFQLPSGMPDDTDTVSEEESQDLPSCR